MSEFVFGSFGKSIHNGSEYAWSLFAYFGDIP